MNISSRLVNLAARQTGQSADELRPFVKESNYLKTSASEDDFAELMADRSEVVLYENTDVIRSMVRANPRHERALKQLYTHSAESRSDGFSLARDVEGQLGPKGGVFSVYDADEPGLVELNYRSGQDFMRVYVDTTPGEPGEQYIIVDQTPMLMKAFGRA